MNLTDLSIKKLRVPERGRQTYLDHTVPGFGVRVSASGHKVFVLVIGRNRRRITIGRYPTISLHEARGRARELIAQRVLGKEDTPTVRFEDAVPLFLAGQFPEHSLKPRTREETERILRKHFMPSLRYDNLSTITMHSIERIIARMHKTPSEARHAFVVIRQFFNWAERRQYVAKNPCANIEPPKPSVPRDRVLTREEVRAVFKAARNNPSTYTNIVQLLLLTGQRRNEIASLQYEWIDFENRTITFPRQITKNKRVHTIPFGPLSEAILRKGHREGFLFPGRGVKTPFDGWSKGKPKFDRACPLPHWTLHDLRRTFATNLAAQGVPVHVTEKLLNHASGVTGGIVAVYQRYTYQDEMREAMHAWEHYLQRLCEDEAYPKTQLPQEIASLIV